MSDVPTRLGPTPPPASRLDPRLKLVLVGLACFLVGTCIGAVVASGRDDEEPPRERVAAATYPSSRLMTSTTSAPTTTAAPTTAAPTTAAAAPPTATREPAPVRVLDLAGTANKTSSTFELRGVEARIRWRCDAYRAGVDPRVVGCSFYLKRPGERGSSAQASQQTPGSDSSSFFVPPGTYFLEVNSANANWSLTLDDMR